MLKRLAQQRLKEWKVKASRKPLLVLGARQVGKTFLLESFAKSSFPNYHLFDFTKDEELIPLFEGSLDPVQLLRRLSTYSGKDIDPATDLIIFDEIQHCPRALTALKYFEKDLPHGYVCGSGSLLGVAFSSSPFPVGKVERLDIAPLNFTEFLYGLGEDQIAAGIEATDIESFSNSSIHKKTWELLRYYFVTGGLPEVVSFFVQNFKQINTAFKGVRELQNRLIRDYEDDFIRYADKENALHIKSVFREVPSQLAKSRVSSGRFVFKGVTSASSTYRDLEGPIEWLQAANLIVKVPIAEHSETPLKAYLNSKLFKLYLFDIGLLGSIVGLTPQSIVSYDYGGYKGFFAENYVLQEMLASSAIEGQELSIVSWSKRLSEIEFLVEKEGEITPIEVKAGVNTKAKSLAIYRELYKPKRSLILSGNPAQAGRNNIERLPLYLAGSLISKEAPS